MKQFEDKLKSVFAQALGIDNKIISNGLAYRSIPQWDSITHMVLISEIESAFDISIETDDVIDMSSFARAVEIVQKYLS